MPKQAWLLYATVNGNGDVKRYVNDRIAYLELEVGNREKSEDTFKDEKGNWLIGPAIAPASSKYLRKTLERIKNGEVCDVIPIETFMYVLTKGDSNGLLSNAYLEAEIFDGETEESFGIRRLNNYDARWEKAFGEWVEYLLNLKYGVTVEKARNLDLGTAREILMVDRIEDDVILLN